MEAYGLATSFSLQPYSGFLAGLLTILALGIWLAEFGRKAGYVLPRPSISLASALLRRSAPEFAGLAVLGAFAACLLVRGEHRGFDTIPDEHSDVWGEITSTWPLLTTADSLFVLQAMVRLVVFASITFRGPTVAPFAGSPAAFAFLAVVCWLLLFVLSPPGVYHVDGPLGGATSIVIEAAAAPLLLFLSRDMSAKGVVAVMVGGCTAACVASFNNFALAGEMSYLDTLFSLVQLFDLLSACAFMTNVAAEFAAGKVCVSTVGIVQCLLPLQALLPAYFFLTAFAPPLEAPPALVRSGWPFEMMWAIGAAQVCIYALAGVLRLACALDSAPDGGLGGALLQVEV